MAITPCAVRSQEIHELHPNLVEKSIDLSIQACERWREVARIIKKVALYIISCSLVITGFFYISPAFPILIAVAIVGLAIFGGGRSDYPRSYTPLNGMVLLLTASITFASRIGNLIYTPQVAAITLVANSIIASFSFCLWSGAEIMYLLLTKRIEFLQQLNIEVRKMEADLTYCPSENTCQILLPLYRELYIKQLYKGGIITLPMKIEHQIDLIHHPKGLCNNKLPDLGEREG